MDQHYLRDRSPCSTPKLLKNRYLWRYDSFRRDTTTADFLFGWRSAFIGDKLRRKLRVSLLLLLFLIIHCWMLKERMSSCREDVLGFERRKCGSIICVVWKCEWSGFIYNFVCNDDKYKYTDMGGSIKYFNIILRIVKLNVSRYHHACSESGTTVAILNHMISNEKTNI